MRFAAWGLCCLVLSAAAQAAEVPFELHGVDPGQFRATTFATGLNYPIGMVELDDGSILVGTSNGSSFFGSTSGSLIRLVDSDDDGVADEQSVLHRAVPGGSLTAVRKQGDLIFTTGQNRPISVFRAGDNAADPVTLLGGFDIRYPSGGWLHPHSALAVRNTPGSDNQVDLFFQIGSRTNFDATSATAQLSSDFGLSGQLKGDSVYMLTVTDDGDQLTASDLTQIATGLRNAAGFAFDDATGDLYLQDNGIDGTSNPNEPISADELNVIRAGDIGGEIEDFGFPTTYSRYRTEDVVGDTGIQPLIAFFPWPPPDGEENEGPNDIALSPALFPDSLAGGIFVGMHGRFTLGGRTNEENPLVFADLEDNSYMHLISNDEPSVGHLDGLLSTRQSLFVADVSPQGGFGGGQANTGVIYQIQGLTAIGDLDEDGDVDLDDADTLSRAIQMMATDVRFDLDGSEMVGADDMWHFVESIVGSRPGDFDLDGDVDLADATNVAANWTGAGAFGVFDRLYSQGDHDGDGDVDAASNVAVAANWTGAVDQTPVAAMPIPEHTAGWPIPLLMLMIGVRSRSRRRNKSQQPRRIPGKTAFAISAQTADNDVIRAASRTCRKIEEFHR